LRPAVANSDSNSNSANQGSVSRRPTFGAILGTGRSGGKKERAVVATLTVTVASLAPLIAAGLGETEQVEAAGAPLQVNEAFPLNPFEPLRLNEKIAVCPAVIV
jgi:hypothetical protein